MHPVLRLLLILEIVSALVGFFYFFRLKNSYWKWFSVYLVVVATQESFWVGRNSFLNISNNDYYMYFGIPIGYLFFYWLYALKSLNNKRLFALCSLTYVITFPLGLYFEKRNLFYSFSENVAVVLLTILIVLEYLKQIKNDNILRFKENKMFYTNIGLILFYIGAYPLFTFGKLLYKEYLEIFNAYYLYFLISNCLMYTLFTASFIWGKERS